MGGSVPERQWSEKFHSTSEAEGALVCKDGPRHADGSVPERLQSEKFHFVSEAEGPWFIKMVPATQNHVNQKG